MSTDPMSRVPLRIEGYFEEYYGDYDWIAYKYEDDEQVVPMARFVRVHEGEKGPEYAAAFWDALVVEPHREYLRELLRITREFIATKASEDCVLHQCLPPIPVGYADGAGGVVITAAHLVTPTSTPELVEDARCISALDSYAFSDGLDDVHVIDQETS